MGEIRQREEEVRNMAGRRRHKQLSFRQSYECLKEGREDLLYNTVAIHQRVNKRYSQKQRKSVSTHMAYTLKKPWAMR